MKNFLEKLVAKIDFRLQNLNQSTTVKNWIRNTVSTPEDFKPKAFQDNTKERTKKE